MDARCGRARRNGAAVVEGFVLKADSSFLSSSVNSSMIRVTSTDRGAGARFIGLLLVEVSPIRLVLLERRICAAAIGPATLDTDELDDVESDVAFAGRLALVLLL